MSYDEQTWVDGEDGDTPISAGRLNHIEQGIGDAHGAVTQLSVDTTTALATKAGAVHTHTQAEVTGLSAALSSLQTQLGNKVDVSVLDSIGSTTSDGGTLVRRTGGGSAIFANVDVENTPTTPSHATRKSYVDAIGNPGQDGTVNSNVVRRDSFGQSWFSRVYASAATPGNADELTRKDYVDALGTASTVADTVVRRDVNGNTRATGFYAEAAPAFADALTRKDYVDSAIATAVAGVSGGTATTYPALGKFRAGLAARNTFPFRIVFAGSSTTAGSNATTTANRYVNRLVTKLQAAYPASGGTESTVVNSTTATLGTLSSAGGVHGYNVGESSTTSATYLDATERTNVGNANPRVVLHMIGANDYGNNTTPATVKANVQTVITDLKSKIAGPCVHLIVHTYARPDVTSPTYAWSLYGAALKQIADADPDNVAFLDISEPYRVSGIAGTDALNLIDTDLLHQTDDGHALMADLIWTALGFPPIATTTVVIGSGGTIAADDFNRADTTTLGSTPTGAKAWTNYGTVAPAIISNQLGVNSATSITAVAVDSSVTSYTVQATLAAITAGAANRQGGLAFRVQDATNFWWLSTRKDATTDGFDLYKNVAGVTTRVTTTATGTVAAGAVLKVVVTPTSITAFVNGTQITSSTDTALSTATRAGFCFGAAGLGTRWDDFSVTA
jgi:lysophospholipase L1-like esterase